MGDGAGANRDPDRKGQEHGERGGVLSDDVGTRDGVAESSGVRSRTHC